MMPRLTLAVLSLTLLLTPAISFAGLHVEKGDARVSHVDALSIMKNNRQHLVVRPHVTVPDGTKTLHWILPIPAPPSRAVALSEPVFRDIDRFVSMEVRAPRTKKLRKERVASPPRSTRINKSSMTLRTFDTADAGAKLRAWLDSNKIKTTVYDPYIERGWSFVVATIDVTALTQKDGALANLPALWVTLGTVRAVIPLRSLEPHGPFAARVTVAQKVPLGEKDLRSARRRGFEVSRGFGVPYYAPDPAYGKPGKELLIRQSKFKPSQLPGGVRDLFRRFLDWKPDESGTLRVLYRSDYGAKVPKAARFVEDLTVPSLRSEKTLLVGSRARVALLQPPKPPKVKLPEPPKAPKTPPAPKKPQPATASSCSTTPASPTPNLPWGLLLLGLISWRSRKRAPKIFP